MAARAVVLLSGGLDSATVLAMAKAQGFAPYALSLRYGQRHSSELDAAARVAKAQGAIRHEVIDLDLRRFGGSALTDDAIALGWAEALGAADLFFGANAVDYSGYPDCRPAYVQAFEEMANLATRAGVEGTRITVHAPIIAMTKAQIITAGT